MAKALVGHISGHDTRLARETLLLRRRVADLEAEIVRLQNHNDALTSALRDREVVDRLAAEPVLEPALH